MKKILMFKIVLFFLVFFTAYACAQSAQPLPEVEKVPAQSRLQIKMVIGKIDGIIFADTEKKIKTQLTVIDEDGINNAFVLADGALIRDGEMNKVDLSKLCKDSKVKVAYHTNSSGINIADSITVLN